MSTTTLLVMDVQNGIVERLGEGADPFIRTVNEAIATARRQSIAIIFVRVAFRPGAPEVSARNTVFSSLASSFELDDDSTQIHPSLDRQASDVVVVKKRVSAFTASDLEVILRAQGTTSLVVCGISTSGVVLSTVRQAADLDFDVTVLRDACFDQDSDVHAVLMDKVLVRQGTVTTTGDWAKSRHD